MLNKIENNLRARYWRWESRNEIPRYQHELAEIIEKFPTREIIVFPPGLSWRDSLFQRPQNLAKSLSDCGNLVLYCEPETTHEFVGFDRFTENLILCHVPLETFEILNKPLVMTMTWNYPYAIQLPGARIIYDLVDHLDVFSGNRKKITKHHQLLLNSADIVLTTSRALYDQVKPHRPDAILCPNGVDYDRFSASTHGNSEPPADIAPILLQGSPTVGYVGALAEWLDFDLLEKVARLRPDVVFILIGPDLDGSTPSKLTEMQNIRCLGVKVHDEVPIYLQYFDVTMIPFLVNEVTHAVSPIKLFEYMAAAKPVISTPLKECIQYPGVLVADSPQMFSNRIEEALQLKSDREYIALLQDVAVENSWENRAEQIMQAINDFYPSNLSVD